MNLPSIRDLGAWSAYGSAGFLLTLTVITVLYHHAGWNGEQLEALFAVLGYTTMIVGSAVATSALVARIEAWTDEEGALTADEIDGGASP